MERNIKALLIKRVVLSVLMFALFVLDLILIDMPAWKINAPALQVVPVEVETAEAAPEIAYMTFTPEEAEALLSRLHAEREAAERAERARAAARRMQVYTPGYFKQAGRIWWGGWSWTYYSERILPGYGLRIPGRHTDSMGYVRDGDGYLCLASDVHRKGTVLETPFGSYGRVYDCGCGNDYTVDVYVNW